MVEVIIPNKTENRPLSSGIQLLRHEYGHTIQLEKLGKKYYTLFVVLPSVTFASLSHMDNQFAKKYYYCLPWEYEADLYGNVPNRWDYYSYHPNTFLWLLAYRKDIREETGGY